MTSLSDHPSLSNHLYDNATSPSDHLATSNYLYTTPTHLSACPSSVTTEHLHDYSQSLAVLNGEQLCKIKIFHRAFCNYNLLLSDLAIASISTSASRHVSPPKSGEDAHGTHEIMGDLGVHTLNLPRLGFSYVLPRLWDPGGASTTSKVPRIIRDQSRSLAASRYLYATHMSNLFSLPSLQQWQDFRMFHVNLTFYFMGIIPS